MSYHSGNELIDPYLLFEKTHLRPGMRVADFGTGRTGHIIFPAATVIGHDGAIFAVDILKDVLEEISKRSKLERLSCIHPIWADIERVGSVAVPEGTLDAVFVVNVLIHTTDREAVMTEAARLLKEKGRLVVVEWTKPNPLCQIPKDHLVPLSHVEGWALAHGFVVQETVDLGKYQRAVIFYKHTNDTVSGRAAGV